MRSKAHLYYTIYISFLSVLLNCFINLYLTPKITNFVGVEAYGFVSLAKTFVSYANIIMTALNSYAARYMTVAYLQNQKDKYNEYLSTVFIADFVIGGAIFVVGLFCIGNLEVILNIPIDLIESVKFLFFLTFLTFYVTTISTVFFATGYIKDRLDINNWIKGFSYISEISILAFCFFVLKPRIWYVGLATVIAALIMLIGTVIMTKKLIPESNVKISNFSKVSLIKLVLSGIWNSANNMGNALNSGLDLLISNRMLSALSMGQVSIAKTINNMLYTVYTTISQPFQPGFLKKYSDGNMEGLVADLKYSMKLCGMITNVFFSGICVMGVPFLKLWIPTQDIYTIYKLTIIAMLPCVSEGCVYPLYYVYTLTVKNKIPCLITILGGICNVLSMCLMLKYTNVGVYSIVITTAVIMNFINLVTNPLYISRCLKVKRLTFYPCILRNICAVFGSIISMKMVAHFFPWPDNWQLFSIEVFICGIVGLVPEVIILFNKDELQKNITFLLSKMLKK